MALEVTFATEAGRDRQPGPSRNSYFVLVPGPAWTSTVNGLALVHGQASTSSCAIGRARDLNVNVELNVNVPPTTTTTSTPCV
jgi:hypothetical protein